MQTRFSLNKNIIYYTFFFFTIMARKSWNYIIKGWKIRFVVNDFIDFWTSEF